MRTGIYVYIQNLIFSPISLSYISGYFPLESEHCLAWICLDVLFCTASIMHLCTISVDRYLSLRYPMRFGRNKTRRRVTLKIVFVWLLSIAMSLPLSLMYSKVSNENNKNYTQQQQQNPPTHCVVMFIHTNFFFIVVLIFMSFSLL